MSSSPVSKNPRSARDRILASAEAVAREAGPANLSLDAVAAHAGVSKGGLLYHFPNKASLLAAMVEGFLADLDRRLQEQEKARGGGPDCVLQAYLDIFLEEQRSKRPPPSGILAAMAESPEFLEPVRRYERLFLDRIRANASDPVRATITFLALHGIRCMELISSPVVSDDEIETAIARMRVAAGA